MKQLAIQVLRGFEANTRRAVKLGNDDPLSAVDDESAAAGHHRQLAHVNALFLGACLVLQLEGHVERGGEGLTVAEGVEGRVPYKGPLSDVIFQLMGGLKSGMGCVGASTLGELRERANFVRVTAGGLRESHVHDIVMTEEPTNYQPLS